MLCIYRLDRSTCKRIYNEIYEMVLLVEIKFYSVNNKIACIKFHGRSRAIVSKPKFIKFYLKSAIYKQKGTIFSYLAQPPPSTPRV